MSGVVSEEKAVVYDLPSENMRIFRLSDVRDKVRSVRVRSVQILHALGVQCTESVILIPRDRVQHISEVIGSVNGAYSRLEEWLRDQGYYIDMQPIIEVLDLTREQVDRLIPIANRRLIRQLDRAINSVSSLIDELAEITQEARLRRVRANLRRLRNNWSDIFSLATQLGIDISTDYRLLIELIDQAMERC